MFNVWKIPKVRTNNGIHVCYKGFKRNLQIEIRIRNVFTNTQPIATETYIYLFFYGKLDYHSNKFKKL